MESGPDPGPALDSVTAVRTPPLHRWKLRLREVELNTQGHTACER